MELGIFSLSLGTTCFWCPRSSSLNGTHLNAGRPYHLADQRLAAPSNLRIHRSFEGYSPASVSTDSCVLLVTSFSMAAGSGSVLQLFDHPNFPRLPHVVWSVNLPCILRSSSPKHVLCSCPQTGWYTSLAQDHGKSRWQKSRCIVYPVCVRRLASVHGRQIFIRQCLASAHRNPSEHADHYQQSTSSPSHVWPDHIVLKLWLSTLKLVMNSAL